MPKLKVFLSILLALVMVVEIASSDTLATQRAEPCVSCELTSLSSIGENKAIPKIEENESLPQVAVLPVKTGRNRQATTEGLTSQARHRERCRTNRITPW